MKKINVWIENHLEKIIILFLLLGPFFDCFTALSIHMLHISFTGIMILKILFLGLLLYDLFFISKCRYRNIVRIAITVILMYMFLFTIQTILHKGNAAFFFECQSLLRTFFFPIVVLCLYNLHLENRFTPKVNNLYCILGTYVILILLPLITHTGFDSYAISKVGTIGWFHSCNEVGGILSIIFPFLLDQGIKRKKWIFLFSLVVFLGVCFSIGTKVPILSVMLTFLAFGLFYLVRLFQNRKWKQISYFFLTVLVGIIGLIFIVPKTSFYKNIQIHLDFLKVDSFSDLLTIQKIDHFVFSERIKFLGNTRESYKKAPFSEKIIGIGYIENYATDEVSTKLIEMDYYDVFFRHGIVGSIVYFLPFIWILYGIVKKMKTKFVLSQGVSILLIVLLSLFSGHILVAPSVSMVVAYILILCLTERGNLDENKFSNGQL